MNKQLMVSRINAAKEKLNLGDSELSVKLGHHRNYISRVLHQENPSLKQMSKVVKKCNDLILFHLAETLKKEDPLNQKLPCGKPLPEFKHTPIVDAVMVSKDEYDSLKKELDHKNQVLDKRNAVLENHIDRVNELELQLKTTQQKFVDVVDQKDSEIKRLQKDCNHATNQYQGKRAQVVRLNEKVKKQASIYMIIIAILFIASIVGFAS
jgi:chromosome segregation ATPase